MLKVLRFLVVAVVSVFVLSIGLSLAQDDLSGTVVFYPQNYYAPEQRPEAAAVAEAVIAEYMAMNPGVTVELEPLIGSTDEYRTWLTTRLSAGQAPNITWEQYTQRNAGGEDVWVPLNEFLEMPNPYIPEGQPGSERWIDSFPADVLAKIRAKDGNFYQIAMDWVETGLFFNKAVFEEVGIDAEWANFTEFVADCQTLKAAGVEPVGFFVTPEWSTYQWLDDIFMTEAFADVGPSWYLPDYTIPGQEFRMVLIEEAAKAVNDGHISVDDPRFDVYLNLTKQFTDNCAMSGFAGGVTYDDVQRLFVEGQVAMAWLGSWSAISLEQSVNFDYGLTYFPPVTVEDGNPFDVNEESSYRVGGPSSSGQYGITQQTAADGLLEEAVDLLMFWSSPAVFQRVYDAWPNYVPVVAGMTIGSLDRLQFVVDHLPERLIGDPQGRLTPQFGTEHNPPLPAVHARRNLSAPRT
ncbi:MAG: extracellular solute-binding protein, partial [Chloroflexi bacterium]|nr:extracellular solute-binding protein [Chloroflexota bacterium]